MTTTTVFNQTTTKKSHACGKKKRWKKKDGRRKKKKEFILEHIEKPKKRNFHVSKKRVTTNMRFTEEVSYQIAFMGTSIKLPTTVVKSNHTITRIMTTTQTITIGSVLTRVNLEPS